MITQIGKEQRGWLWTLFPTQRLHQNKTLLTWAYLWGQTLASLRRLWFWMCTHTCVYVYAHILLIFLKNLKTHFLEESLENSLMSIRLMRTDLGICIRLKYIIGPSCPFQNLEVKLHNFLKLVSDIGLVNFQYFCVFCVYFSKKIAYVGNVILGIYAVIYIYFPI